MIFDQNNQKPTAIAAILRGPCRRYSGNQNRINKITSPFFGITLKSSHFLSSFGCDLPNFRRNRRLTRTLASSWTRTLIFLGRSNVPVQTRLWGVPERKSPSVN